MNFVWSITVYYAVIHPGAVVQCKMMNGTEVLVAARVVTVDRVARIDITAPPGIAPANIVIDCTERTQ